MDKIAQDAIKQLALSVLVVWEYLTTLVFNVKMD
jgi:hypothetical protein